MQFTSLVNPGVLTQPIYEPGKPIDDVARELGFDPATVLKLASNENPLGASPRGLEAARAALAQLSLYPDGGAVRLRAALAERHRLRPDQFVIGNGSNELIELIGHVFLRPGDEVVMGTPAFIVYKLVTRLFGASAIEVPLVKHRHDLAAMAAVIGPETKLVFLPSPNNPTGTANSAAEITSFARSLPGHVVLVLDEAYAEYADDPVDIRPLIAEGRQIIALRTFSKIFGLAALRVGYGYMDARVASLIQRVRQPFNVNAVGLAAAAAAVSDQAWLQHCRRANRAGLVLVEEALTEIGLEWVPSEANFILVRVGDGPEIFARLQAAGVIVRPLGPYGLPEWLRITIGDEPQNLRMLGALRSALGPGV